jgi:hypothetical protein
MTPYCSVCGEPFQSQGLFDKHRVGKYDPDERRCLTPEEMRAKGWRFDGRTWRGKSDGFWEKKRMEMSDDAR